jgi:hypothetical protein
MPDWRLSLLLNEKRRKQRTTAKVREDIKPKAKQNQGVKYGDLVACTIRVKEPRWWKGSPEDNAYLKFLSVTNKAAHRSI